MRTPRNFTTGSPRLGQTKENILGTSPDGNGTVKRSLAGTFMSLFKIPSSKGSTSTDSEIIEEWNLKDFDSLCTLGQGYFGKVKLALHRPTDTYYAIKVISKKRILKSVTKLKEEIQIQRKLNSPFLLKLHKVFDTDTKIHLVIDFLDGGDLRSLLHQQNDKMDENSAKFYFVELMIGIQDLHRCGIVHRDLKPENILLESTGHLKICDYGLSKKLKNGEKTYSFVGTPEYICRDFLLSGGHDFAVDYWSLGITLFELLCGFTPFQDQNTTKLKKNILMGNVEFPDYLSPEVKDLIGLLLEKDCEKRKRNWKKIDAHPWLKDMDFKLAKKRGLCPPLKPEKREVCLKEEIPSPVPIALTDMEKKIFVELAKLCDY
jgi:serine/threonine protein kinase